ncbi:MAG: hypothetical protein ACLSU0_05385 [Oscillospiraceae bacterium]
MTGKSSGYELLFNAIGDERGKPRVMNCLAATLSLRFLDYGYRLRSK